MIQDATAENWST